MLSWIGENVCALPGSDSNEVFLTDIVYCVFNWASLVAANRCFLPFPWFVKQIIIILWCQTKQTTSHPVFNPLLTQWIATVQSLLIHTAGLLRPICHTIAKRHIVLHEGDTVMADSDIHLFLICEWSDYRVHKWSEAEVASSFLLLCCEINDGRQTVWVSSDCE